MNPPRRFLNLVLHSNSRAVKSLHRINLARQSFFNPAAATTATTTINGIDGPEPAVPQDSGSWIPGADANKNNKLKAGDLKTGLIRIPGPSISFSATPGQCNWKLDCLSLAENKIVCVDHLARVVLYDCDEHRFVIMPSLHVRKQSPISLSITNTKEDGESLSLYIMEKTFDSFRSHLFEAFIQSKHRGTNTKVWECHSLLSPPYTPYFRGGVEMRNEITSYAVLNSGSHICISMKELGTYSFDTVTNTWSHVAKWTLPFCGKAEYVPELKLWLGFSAEAQLCAVDLSNLDSRPQVVNAWMEFDPPEGWMTYRDSELVRLGSGRFCIARFYEVVNHADTALFNAASTSDNSYCCYSDDESPLVLYDRFSVMTGVEVVSCSPREKHYGNGNGNSGANCNANSEGRELQMIKHKSRRYIYTTRTIDSIF